MRPVGLALALALALACGTARAAEAPKTLVFFEPWSAALGESAIGALAEVAAQAKQIPSAPIVVSGFASTIGSKEANQLLSRLRAQMVTDQLVADGIDPQRIRVKGEGEVPYAQTPLESRRVEITVGEE